MATNVFLKYTFLISKINLLLPTMLQDKTIDFSFTPTKDYSPKRQFF